MSIDRLRRKPAAPWRRRLMGALIALMGAIGATACGTDTNGQPRGGSTETVSDSGMHHIHGLGVVKDTLYIATHTGLWTAAHGEIKARRVSDLRQDVMGFSVVDGRRFIGSGHPDPQQDLPPLLGLIESRDGGKTWKNVSLLGQADFHVLESSGSRVYGFDTYQGRLLVSDDGGTSWTERAAPAEIYSLAIAPGAPDRIVVATGRGLLVSRDAGRRFKPVDLGGELAGLLAWPAPDRLFLVDGDGQVRTSVDHGATWESMGTVDGEPVAFIADGEALYLALADGSVRESNDEGRSWRVRATD